MKWKSLLIAVLMVAMAAGTALAQTNITFWTTEVQSDRTKVIRLILDTFEALNPDIKVKLVPIEENNVPTQLAASSAAGTLPDIMEIGSELSVTYGSSGLLDVKAQTDLVSEVGKNRFFKGALKMVAAPDGSGYYGIPYHGWIQGIWYRGDWFEKAGLAPPDSWENILKAAKHFYSPKDNRYGILVGTKPEAYAEQVFTQFAISNNAHEFSADGKLIFNSPAMKETLEFYKKLAAYNPPGPQNWRARDYYLQGKLAMFFYSTYIMDDLALAEVAASSLTSKHFKDLKGAEFDPKLVKNTRMAPIIRHKKDASYGVLVTLNLVNTKDAARQKASRKLAKYMFEESAYVSFLHMAPGGMNPVLKDVAKSDAFLKDPKNIFARYGKDKMYAIASGMDAVQKFEIVGGKVFPVSGEIFAKQIIPQMIYKVVFENVPCQEALDQAEAKMKKVIAEYEKKKQ